MIEKLVTDLLPYVFYFAGSICFAIGTAIVIFRELVK